MVSAFSHLTNATCELTALSPQDVFVLQMDASLFGLGAVLSVIQNGKDMLVAFYSHQTRGAERDYSVMELEALGEVAAIEHFAHYLYDREFTVYTDYKALCFLLSSRSLKRPSNVCSE